MEPSTPQAAAPDKLSIDTPELISLEFRVAGIGSRFLALALDSIVQLAVYAVIAVIVVLATTAIGSVSQSGALWPLAIFVLLIFCLHYGYFAAFEALWNGQTPGKRLVRLRVIRDSGRPITVYDALARNLLRVVDSLPAFYCVGVITALISPRSKRVGDYVAGTVVVHEPDPVAAPTGWEAAPPVDEVSVDDLAPLSAAELDLVEAFLVRRWELGAEHRERIARGIARRLGMGEERIELRLEALARRQRR